MSPITFEEGLVQALMDPDRLRSARVKSQTEVDEVETDHDTRNGPYIPHHHRVTFEGSRH